MNPDSFWPAFWPNAASTLLGVVLGLPVALWLNRLAQRSATEQAVQDDRARLRHGLDAIVIALTHNESRLAELLAGDPGDPRQLPLMVDFAAWDAAREEIVPFLRRPELQRRIAFHFAQIHTLEQLAILFVNGSFVLTASNRSWGTTHDFFKRRLTTMATELMAESSRLREDLASIQKGHFR